MVEKLKIAGIILAAGSASRMGKTKQMLPFDRTNILGRVIEQALSASLDKRVIVLGHKAGIIKKDIATRFKDADLTIISNPDYKSGQSTSLIAGLRSLPNDIDAAMFLLADQPLICPAVINRLIASYKKNNAPIVIPFYKNRRGNPVIIARSLFSELAALKKDTGARVLFEKYQDRILKVTIENPCILIDIDTPQDYQKAVAIIQKKDEA